MDFVIRILFQPSRRLATKPVHRIAARRLNVSRIKLKPVQPDPGSTVCQSAKLHGEAFRRTGIRSASEVWVHHTTVKWWLEAGVSTIHWLTAELQATSTIHVCSELCSCYPSGFCQFHKYTFTRAHTHAQMHIHTHTHTQTHVQRHTKQALRLHVDATSPYLHEGVDDLVHASGIYTLMCVFLPAAAELTS